MTPKEVLQEAANVIRTHGWAQGDYIVNGSYCTLGAIDHVLEKFEDEIMWVYKLRNKVTGPIQEVLRRKTGSVIIHNWNDAEGRTKEEVLEVFEEAIKIAEG